MTLWWEIREAKRQKAREAAARLAWGYKHWYEYHWGHCPQCGGPFEHPRSGRRRVWCSDACKMRAYRQRKAERDDLPPYLRLPLSQELPPDPGGLWDRLVGWLNR
jgi:hypothetical protein